MQKVDVYQRMRYPDKARAPGVYMFTFRWGIKSRGYSEEPHLYVGRSMDMSASAARHVALLRKKAHWCKRLQTAIDKNWDVWLDFDPLPIDWDWEEKHVKWNLQLLHVWTHYKFKRKGYNIISRSPNRSAPLNLMEVNGVVEGVPEEFWTPRNDYVQVVSFED